MIVGLFVVSLSVSILGVAYSPNATFFLLPTRAWELMMGAALATGVIPALGHRAARTALASLGLMCIAVPVFAYDNATPFPGLAALLPCAGTAAVLYAAQGTVVARALSWRPLVGVGLISYSLYLWHWPIFVFVRQIEISTTMSPSGAASGLTLAFILAILSFYFVEKPLRDRARTSASRVWLISSVGTALVATIAGAVIFSKGFPHRFDPEVISLAGGTGEMSVRGKECLNQPLGSPLCHLGAAGEPTYVVWGDSHAAALATGLASRLAGQPGLLAARNSCPPAAGATYAGFTVAGQQACDEFRSDVVATLAPTVETVILVANWPNYDSIADEGELRSGLHRTIAELKESRKRVVLIVGLPTPGFDAPWASALTAARGGGQLVIPNRVTPFEVFATTLQAGADVEVINLRPAFCDLGECRIQDGSRMLFADANHATEFANSHVIAPYLVGLVSAANRPL